MPGWWNGRHQGLKIPCQVFDVRVRVPLLALFDSHKPRASKFHPTITISNFRTLRAYFESICVRRLSRRETFSPPPALFSPNPFSVSIQNEGRASKSKSPDFIGRKRCRPAGVGVLTHMLQIECRKVLFVSRK